MKSGVYALAAALMLVFCTSFAWARDVEYQGQEIKVHVVPGEPTQIQFPSKIASGYKKKRSALSLDRKDNSLIVFANEPLAESGEALLVSLDDGRSYSVRMLNASPENPRDNMIRINDERGGLILGSEEEDPKYLDKKYEYAPPSQVSGFTREMILVAEFGKKGIQGYRISDAYKGQSVLNDGTIQATIDRIFIGQNLWGYVIDVRNLLSTSQRLNPASFRLDGTRAVSAKNWELAAVPLNIEQQLARAHETKVYIVTRARKAQ